ncbi:MAG: hypothetical protein WDA02_03610 [Saccharofermentanales bacterium]|jgi:hypothetical protein
MKDISKRLTQYQKESIYQFYADWILSNKKINFRNNSETSGGYFKDGDVEYESYMDLFDKSKLFSIIVTNNIKDILINISVNEINDKNNINIINNFILKNKPNTTILSDIDFTNMTNIEVNKSKLRFKKINKIINNI